MMMKIVSLVALILFLAGPGSNEVFPPANARGLAAL